MTKDFESEFPSLKDKIIPYDRWEYMYENTIHISDLQQHCRDNQRIKEVIKNYVDNGGSPSYAKEILEELGL